MSRRWRLCVACFSHPKDGLWKNRKWEGKTSNVMVEKPSTHVLKQVVTFDSWEMSHVDSTYPDMMWPEGHLTSVVFTPQTHYFTLSMWKTSSAKPKLKDIVQNSWPGFLNTIRVMKQRAHQRTQHSPEEIRSDSKSNVVSWMRTWGRKGTFIEKWVTPEKVWNIVMKKNFNHVYHFLGFPD